MSFFSSIGKALKKVVKAVPNAIVKPITSGIGAILGGPVGGAIGGAIGTAALKQPEPFDYANYSYKVGEQYAMQNIQPIPLYGAGMAGTSLLPTIARAAYGLIRGTTGKILKVVLPSGKTVTRRKAAQLIKRVGLEAGALALGIGVVEAAQLLLDDQASPRRRRGITGAQLANARRVVCTINRMHKSLGCSTTRRRTSCR